MAHSGPAQLRSALQTWARSHLSAERAAVVMTLEPVWAGVSAVLFGEEVRGARVVIGGALVLAAMHLAERGRARPRAGHREKNAARHNAPRRAGPARRPWRVSEADMAAGEWAKARNSRPVRRPDRCWTATSARVTALAGG